MLWCFLTMYWKFSSGAPDWYLSDQGINSFKLYMLTWLVLNMATHKELNYILTQCIFSQGPIYRYQHNVVLLQPNLHHTPKTQKHHSNYGIVSDIYMYHSNLMNISGVPKNPGLILYTMIYNEEDQMRIRASPLRSSFSEVM